MKNTCGETLPVQQQVYSYRVKVVTALLKAGIPLSKLDCLRDILEENAFRLTDRRHMFDLVPFVLNEEIARLKNEIDGKYLSLIFDGTSRLGEAMAVVRFVSSDWTLEQRLLSMQMLSKSMTGEEVARELISVLSVQYGVQSKFLLGAMRDRASVNNANSEGDISFCCRHWLFLTHSRSRWGKFQDSFPNRIHTLMDYSFQPQPQNQAIVEDTYRPKSKTRMTMTLCSY